MDTQKNIQEELNAQVMGNIQAEEDKDNVLEFGIEDTFVPEMDIKDINEQTLAFKRLHGKK